MKVLLVIDMQNDFVTGTLGSKDAQEIVANVVEKIENYDGRILYTRDSHSDDYLSTQEGKNLPVLHCIQGSVGHDIIPEISNRVNISEEDVINKISFGCASLSEFIASRCDSSIEEITLIGLCTDICVISNAMLLKAAMPECKLIVDASCCAGVTKESHNTALEAMKMCQIEIVNQ